MGTTTIKESRLHIRCDDRARQLLDKAATYARVSVSEFVLSHALASAERVVQADFCKPDGHMPQWPQADVGRWKMTTSKRRTFPVRYFASRPTGLAVLGAS